MSEAEAARLIVNADDYGYFPCVSRGILAAACDGIVTATGILANSVHLDEHVEWLRSAPGLDLGVHLTLTSGTPLSDVMQHRLRSRNGLFPDKMQIALAVSTGQLKAAEVMEEWQWQIEACLARGIAVRFLNSHEHIHMLPTLFSVAQGLADQYGIAHVRCSASEVPFVWNFSSMLRSMAIGGLHRLNRGKGHRHCLPFFGLGATGRISYRYLERLMSRLESGCTYELMCHPGYRLTAEITDRRLLAYHDWEGELRALTSPATRALCDHHGVQLIGYRDLPAVEAASRAGNANT